MKTITFITSYLTFYLKGEIKLEENFVKFQIPNTILGVIPLGSHKKSSAVNQIASVDNSFKVLVKNFLVGLVIAIIGLACMGSSVLGGLILLVIGALGVLNSLQTVLYVTMTSGQVVEIPFIIFEKAKATEAEEEINNLISGRMNDTNNRKQTDRIVDAIEKKK